jgi:hypothetical protein
VLAALPGGGVLRFDPWSFQIDQRQSSPRYSQLSTSKVSFAALHLCWRESEISNCESRNPDMKKPIGIEKDKGSISNAIAVSGLVQQQEGGKFPSSGHFY